MEGSPNWDRKTIGSIVILTKIYIGLEVWNRHSGLAWVRESTLRYVTWATIARQLLRWMWCVRRRTLVEYYVSGVRARLDRTVGWDGSVLLYTVHWQESSVVEHQCLPQSSALLYVIHSQQPNCTCTVRMRMPLLSSSHHQLQQLYPWQRQQYNYSAMNVAITLYSSIILSKIKKKPSYRRNMRTYVYLWNLVM